MQNELGLDEGLDTVHQICNIVISKCMFLVSYRRSMKQADDVSTVFIENII